MTTILNEFVNQTSFMGVVGVLNNEASGYLGVLIFLGLFFVSMIFSLRTLDSERALLVSFLAGLIFSLMLYYMNMLAVWWVAFNIVGFVGTAIYSYLSD